MKNVPYRLGIDLGSNSLGWALLRLDAEGQPDYLLRLGVRIFDNGRNPKDGASHAVDRRLARQQRRRRDRMLRRKRRLMVALREFGLFPVAKEAGDSLKDSNPYEFRHRGLTEPLELFQFGRAIIHLNQRRGFRSSRRTDRGDDAAKEKGKISTAVAQLKGKLAEAGVESLGSLLHARQRSGLGVRVRRVGDGAKATYEFYPDRKMLEAEFDLLWERQAAFHPDKLNATARDRIRGILLFQRPLRPVRPGRCSLDPTIDRAPVALPSVERFRIWQEVNNLRWRRKGDIQEYTLDDAQRRAVFDALDTSGRKSFVAIRKLARLPASAEFNLQGIKRDFLLGNRVGSALADKDCIGDSWHTMSAEEQDALVAKLLDDRLADDELYRQLQSDYELSAEKAEAVMGVGTPDGYARVGGVTIQKLLPHLETGLTYDKAVLAAGFDGVIPSGDGSWDELPYYGKVLQRHVAFGKGHGSDEENYGRIANPSVHIALNQLRHLVNALIKRYGKPQEVVLELTRDIKLGWKRAREIEAEQKQRQDENDRLRDELESHGIAVTSASLLRLRLYRELCGTDGLSAPCVYTGEQISFSDLFSPQVEVDHVLPYSRTLDDSIANKVLCKVRANRIKGNLPPWEAFGQSPEGFSWEKILERAATLRRNRYRRFAQDAMERFGDGDAFLARQLNDTAYMSRIAREYVTYVCRNVWSSSGQLTGKLRAKWGLNKLLSHDDLKNRRDHRHHAIDAVVIASIDRSLVKRVADASARASAAHTGRLLDDLDSPWSSFRFALENALARMVVSYRPDHGVAAALHNATAYGFVEDTGSLEAGVATKVLVQHRISVADLASRKPADIRDAVAGEKLAEDLAQIVERHGSDKKALQGAIDQFSTSSGVRRVRWRENQTVIPIADHRTGRVYKGFKGDGNHCYEIYAGRGGKWTGEVISKFAANGPKFREFAKYPGYRKTSFSGCPLIMRLIQGDYVKVHLDDKDLIYRVQKFSKGVIVLAYHLGAGDQEENPLLISGVSPVRRVAPSTLQSLRGRRIFVDILGRVFDPGFSDAASNTGNSGGRPIPVC